MIKFFNVIIKERIKWKLLGLFKNGSSNPDEHVNFPIKTPARLISPVSDLGTFNWNFFVYGFDSFINE